MTCIFIHYPKCSTCKKAKKYLQAHAIPFEERDIVKDTPTKEELRSWYDKSQLPLKKFFNTSGLIYKEQHLKEKLETLSEEEQLKLLSSNGMLIKRPILITTDAILLGFHEKTWEEVLKKTV